MCRKLTPMFFSLLAVMSFGVVGLASQGAQRIVYKGKWLPEENRYDRSVPLAISDTESIFLVHLQDTDASGKPIEFWQQQTGFVIDPEGKRWIDNGAHFKEHSCTDRSTDKRPDCRTFIGVYWNNAKAFYYHVEVDTWFSDGDILRHASWQLRIRDRDIYAGHMMGTKDGQIFIPSDTNLIASGLIEDYTGDKKVNSSKITQWRRPADGFLEGSCLIAGTTDARTGKLSTNAYRITPEGALLKEQSQRPAPANPSPKK